MTNPLHQPLPYPQTRQSAAAALRDAGICIKHWALDLGLTRDAVVDALRGKDKGHRGTAHRAAIALGLKPGPGVAPAVISPAVTSADQVDAVAHAAVAALLDFANGQRSATATIDAVAHAAVAALLDFANGQRSATATLDALLPALLLLTVTRRVTS